MIKKSVCIYIYIYTHTHTLADIRIHFWPAFDDLNRCNRLMCVLLWQVLSECFWLVTTIIFKTGNF